MNILYSLSVAREEIGRFIADVLAIPAFWRALRRAWPYDNHDERVAAAGFDIGSSYMERVEYAEAKARGETL